MAKIIAMYKTPADPAAFDRYYFGPHVPTREDGSGPARDTRSRAGPS